MPKKSKPRNPFNRQYSAEKAGSIVCFKDSDNDEIMQAQFNTDPTHEFYRPIESPKKDPSQTVFNGFYSPSAAPSSALSVAPSPALSAASSDALSSAASTLALSFSPFPSFPDFGHTPGKTEMRCKRKTRLSYADNTDKENKKEFEGAVLFFSPERNESPKLKRSGTKRKRPSKSSDTLKKKLDLFTLPAAALTKGGDRTPIDLQYRNRKKAFSQFKIMGQSANDALLEAISNGKEKYEAAVLEKLNFLAANVSMEWLHCLAFCLAPKDFDPQQPGNLGAGPDYINSLMMVLENVAFYFAKKYPSAVSVLPLFKMLEGTQVIDEIEYEVTIQKNEKIIRFINKIKAIALLDRSNWPSCSDTDQLINIAEELFENGTTQFKRIKTE